MLVEWFEYLIRRAYGWRPRLHIPRLVAPVAAVQVVEQAVVRVGAPAAVLHGGNFDLCSRTDVPPRESPGVRRGFRFSVTGNPIRPFMVLAGSDAWVLPHTPSSPLSPLDPLCKSSRRCGVEPDPWGFVPSRKGERDHGDMSRLGFTFFPRGAAQEEKPVRRLGYSHG